MLRKDYDKLSRLGLQEDEANLAVSDGKILVGNSSGVGAEVSVSGDLTLTNAGVAAIASGVIVNADINASAAIAFSKLAALSSTNILVGNGSNVATAVAMSGDATLANTGAITIANDAVDKDKLDYETVTVSISGAASGTGTCTTGSEIVGWHVTAITGTERVKTIGVSGTTVTVTLSGSDTATVKVVLIKA